MFLAPTVLEARATGGRGGGSCGGGGGGRCGCERWVV